MALHNWHLLGIKLVRSQTSNIMKSATTSRSLNELDCNASLENSDQAIRGRRSSLRIEKQNSKTTDSKSLVTQGNENGARSLRSFSSPTAPSQTTSAASHDDTDEMSVL